jgi:adenosylcobinamide-GDP ribazoletransferase
MPDPRPPFAAGDLAVALSLLTRLPVPLDHARAGARAGAAAWAYPLVGALVGATTGGAYAALAALGAAPGLAAAAALAAGLLLTGALHEDGLADVADGFGGGFTPERRLEIMRDSRHGTYGVAALTLALLAKWSLLAALSGPEAVAALAAAAALGRAVMGPALRWTPPARRDGLGAGAGRPAAAPALAAAALGAALALALGAPPAALAAAALAALAVVALARRLIGGQTGDVLGAAALLAEIAALGTMV